MTRYITGLLCVLTFLACVAAAQQQAVTYVRNNQRRTLVGEVEETAEGYKVKTDYGTVMLTKQEVVSITDVADTDDEYATRKAKLKEGDLDGLTDLAQWAMNEGMLDRAEADLQTVLKQEPGNARARLLLQRLATLRQQQNGGAAGPARRPRPGGGNRQEWLVSMEDVYHIRREELWSSEPQLGIQLRNNVARRFARAMAGQEEFRDPDFADRFLGQNDLRQAEFIIRKTAPGSEFREDIIIKTDPRFMRRFNREIWPLIEQSCASPSCHGGRKARGGLKLFPGGNGEPRVRYTNFLILDGTRDGQGRPILNRGAPEDSLLLEYLLPEDAQKYKHPKKLTPRFSDRTDRKYRAVQDWIARLENFPKRPDYSVLDYKPPFGMKLQFVNPTAVHIFGPGATGGGNNSGGGNNAGNGGNGGNANGAGGS
jgi:hypothetical protein